MPFNSSTGSMQEKTGHEGLGSGGGYAVSALELSAAGWRNVLWRTYQAISRHRLGLLAAGVSFYMLFAIFPGLTALISLFGLLADPATVSQQFQPMRRILPEQAWSIIHNQLVSLTSHSNNGLSLAGLISFAFALYSTRLAALAMMDALNTIHEKDEERSFVRVNLLALLFTIGAILSMIFFIGAIVFAPIALGHLGLGESANLFVRYLRWPLVALAMVFGLAITYRYAPVRPPPAWRLVTFGSIAATLLWLAASVGFSWYVQAFGSYDKLYGSLGAVIILLFWFWLTAFVVLLGAELDAQIAHEAPRATMHRSGDGQNFPNPHMRIKRP
jgi:membrane protein